MVYVAETVMFMYLKWFKPLLELELKTASTKSFGHWSLMIEYSCSDSWSLTMQSRNKFSNLEITLAPESLFGKLRYYHQSRKWAHPRDILVITWSKDYHQQRRYDFYRWEKSSDHPWIFPSWSQIHHLHHLCRCCLQLNSALWPLIYH